VIQLLALLLFATPALAQDITLAGKIEQGGVMIGTAPVGSRVSFAGHEIPVGGDGRFVVGIDRDAKETAALTITAPDGAREVKQVAIAPRDWEIERVDGLQQQLVTPDPELLKKIVAENKFWAEARKQLNPTAFFASGFILPTEGRLSGHFGRQRILNGEPRAPHSGMDIAAKTGTPVRAAADGIISMKKDMLIMTGNSLMINHGLGLQTFYIHLSKINVSDGQHVRQGEVIGEVGMTGRATGPHLHFGATWFDQRLDPETLLAALPAK
jgi:murein DD-endopeptidase MepM/ murein hydrolase activator NlpD